MAQNQGEDLPKTSLRLDELSQQQSTSYPCTQSGRANCRVCLEEDSVDTMTQPCSCSGSMQYVHRDCLQMWINEKGCRCCEICRQAYQGSYSYPAPRPATQRDSHALLAQLQMHGVIVRADRVTGTITLQRQAPLPDDEDDLDEARPSGAAWCFTAVMAFMAMLLIRHMFELFDDEQTSQPVPDTKAADGVFGPEASAGMLMLWLTVRFLVILVPMYAVLRVMHSVRDQQLQQDDDRDLEQELAALLWSMEAGTGQVPAASTASERVANRAAERAAARAQEREAQLPLIV